MMQIHIKAGLFPPNRHYTEDEWLNMQSEQREKTREERLRDQKHLIKELERLKKLNTKKIVWGQGDEQPEN